MIFLEEFTDLPRDLSILLRFSSIYWKTFGFAGDVRIYRETCGFPGGLGHLTCILDDLLGDLWIS